MNKKKTSAVTQRLPANAQAVAKPPKESKRMDTPFMIVVLILLAVGLVMVFSSSYAASLDKYGTSFHYITRQAAFAAFGVVAMLIISRIDYHFYRKFVFPLFIACIALMLLVLILGEEKNGAKRWLDIGITELQPSDIMKFALILLFAHLIALNYKRMGTFSYGVLPFAIILMLVAGLMMLQPHLSGTILMFLIGMVMMFIGGTKLRYFLVLLITAVAGLGAIVLIDSSYMMSRIHNWLNPFENLTSANWQTAQSLIAIGSGGLFGRGLGASHQKFLWLPEPYNDFIFAIVCEELGLIGAMLIIILFVVFAWRGYSIAAKAPDRFGFLLGVGIVTQICIQTVLNIAVVTNTIPNTGISLPFFSYGGTALLMQLGEMGILLNISRQANIEKL